MKKVYAVNKWSSDFVRETLATFDTRAAAEDFAIADFAEDCETHGVKPEERTVEADDQSNIYILRAESRDYDSEYCVEAIDLHEDRSVPDGWLEYITHDYCNELDITVLFRELYDKSSRGVRREVITWYAGDPSDDADNDFIDEWRAGRVGNVCEC